MVAGEASGDLLAGLLLGGLRSRWPALQTFGIGGPRMNAQGFESWWSHEKLAVRGYVEVLRHYRELLRIRTEVGDRILLERPDAFIGVDAPDFNLGLEARLKARGIKSIHFVSPSIWAWRGERVKKMHEAVDHVLCLFPFEPALYAEHGIDATYVGHPLADAIPLEVPRRASRQALGYTEDDPVVALLPGSRRAEIHYIAPRILEGAAELQARRPDTRFVLPIAPGLRSLVEPLVRRHAAGVQLQMLEGRSHEALAACDVAMVASGTATLEAALFKRPMVIAYNMNFVSWLITKHLKYQPWVGLPNILLRDFAVPELLQGNCTPYKLAGETLRWLGDPLAGAELARRFEALHLQLRRDTARTATDAIEKILSA
jgi:lipid-A-disaccharide synthase